MSSSYRLIVVTQGAERRQRIYDFDADVVRIGRDELVEVRLPHPNVSKVHLRLERRDGRMFAVDAGSTNGTRIGDERLEPGAPRELGDGAVLSVGERFQVAYYARSPDGVMLTGPKVTADLARQLVEDLLATGAAGEVADAGAAPELVGERGVVKGQRYRLPAPDGRLRFGRGQECDVILIDPDLSREHFEVCRGWNGSTIADLGSKNGTRLDGRRLPADEQTPLGDGAVVRAGGCELAFVDPAARYLAQLEQLVADAPVEPAPGDGDDAPPPAEPEDLPAGEASWVGQVVDPDDPAGEPVADAPERGGGASRYLPLIVLGALVIAAVAGLVLLFTS